MADNMYLWVLDFEKGEVFKYDVTEVFFDEFDYNHEDFLNENKHNSSKCEWMLTESELINKTNKQ
tara:strand:- start:2150 stop:2344 length:195 start_codon:yes stop_codon:yes gene_type:complete